MGKIGKPQRSKKHKKLKSVGSSSLGKGGRRRDEGTNQRPKAFTQEVPRKLRDLGIAIKDVKDGRVGKKSRNKYLKKPDAPKKNDIFAAQLNFSKENEQKDKESSDAKSTDTSLPGGKKMGKRKQMATKEAYDEYISSLKPTRPLVESFEFKKRKDESEFAFMRRVDEETERAVKKSAIADQFDTGDQKKIDDMIKKKLSQGSEKKKENKEKLKSRKKRKAEARKEKRYDEFSDLQDKVEFGDVVHAPPSLSVLPKKAVVVGADRPALRMPELKEAFIPKPSNVSGHDNASQMMIVRAKGKTVKRKSLSAFKQLQSDAAREDFILAYRQMKAKKARLKE